MFVSCWGLSCTFVHFLFAVFGRRYEAFANGDDYVIDIEAAAIDHAVDRHLRKTVET